MKKNLCMLAVSLFFLSATAFSQEKKAYKISCIAFYNLENLFDTINQPNVFDEEYTPTGPMQWATMKYTHKLHNMAYAISQVGSEYVSNGPAILGVSEIENEQVLKDLIAQPELKNSNYGIVHYDSPDRRGVDVGLLYKKDQFTVTGSKSYRLFMPNDTNFLTRDQLLVEGLLDGDKMYVIVNHWPSRFNSEKYRIAAAKLSRHITDSLLKINENTRVVIMGDLNDDPTDESCYKTLNVGKDKKKLKEGQLYNPMIDLFNKGIGSLAYNDKWNLFDQIIISQGWLGERGTAYTQWKTEVFNRSFLIQQEGRFKGYPLRTHAGGAWLNGYSDHFPVMMYVIKEVK